MMKKTTVLLLALALIFSLTSCISGNTTESLPADISRAESNPSESVSADSSEPVSVPVSTPETSEPETSELPYVSLERYNEKSECLHGAMDSPYFFHCFDTPFWSSKDGVAGYTMPGKDFDEWFLTDQKEQYVRPCVNSDGDIVIVRHNLAEFIREFDVDREKTEHYYYTVNYDMLYYDFDLLFDAEYDEVWDAYASKEYRDYIEAQVKSKACEQAISRALYKMYIDKDSYPEDYCLCSIPQYVKLYNIPRETLEKLISDQAKIMEENFRTHPNLYDAVYTFSYDLDKIYNNDPELEEMMAKIETGEVYPMEINEWLRVVEKIPE